MMVQDSIDQEQLEGMGNLKQQLLNRERRRRQKRAQRRRMKAERDESRKKFEN